LLCGFCPNLVLQQKPKTKVFQTKVEWFFVILQNVVNF
jgi:hypothetical protein